MQLKQKLIAEFIGTAFLLATVVGSGIMGERLAGGNVAIALLANTLATGAVDEAVSYIVGAYITAAYWFTASTSFANPAVTVARCLSDTFAGIRPQDVVGFIGAQIVGAAAAAVLFQWFNKGAETA